MTACGILSAGWLERQGVYSLVTSAGPRRYVVVYERECSKDVRGTCHRIDPWRFLAGDLVDGASLVKDDVVGGQSP
jgi:hypothetical protein